MRLSHKEGCLTILTFKISWKICRNKKSNNQNLKQLPQKWMSKFPLPKNKQKHNQKKSNLKKRSLKPLKKMIQLKMLRIKEIINTKRKILRRRSNFIKKLLIWNQTNHYITIIKQLLTSNSVNLLKPMSNSIKLTKYLKRALKIIPRKAKFWPEEGLC